MTMTSIIECSLSIFQIPPLFHASINNITLPHPTSPIPIIPYYLLSFCYTIYMWTDILYYRVYTVYIYKYICSLASPASLHNLTTNNSTLPLLRLLLHQLLPAHPPRSSTYNLQDTFQLFLISRRIYHDEACRHGPQITPPPALSRQWMPLAPAPFDHNFHVRRMQR